MRLREAQKYLGANEALLLFTTTEHFTFVWTVTWFRETFRSLEFWSAKASEPEEASLSA